MEKNNVAEGIREKQKKKKEKKKRSREIGTKVAWSITSTDKRPS